MTALDYNSAMASERLVSEKAIEIQGRLPWLQPGQLPSVGDLRRLWPALRSSYPGARHRKAAQLAITDARDPVDLRILPEFGGRSVGSADADPDGYCHLRRAGSRGIQEFDSCSPGAEWFRRASTCCSGIDGLADCNLTRWEAGSLRESADGTIRIWPMPDLSTDRHSTPCRDRRACSTSSPH